MKAFDEVDDDDLEFAEKGSESGKLYQDQLYGTKVLTPLSDAVINTPEFQRLAGLRQLGFSDLVYRGAMHTRFAHSVGTYLLTRTIMRRIVQNHERLGLTHPGEGLHECFRVFPHNAFPRQLRDEERVGRSNQSLWRGLTEVVSIAGLLHDIGHVPFGHTLEDEFSGIYERHDRLAGPRVYEMLFNEQSRLAGVFSPSSRQWISGPAGSHGIKNEELAQLIYLILNFKEEINPPAGFDVVLNKAIEDLGRRPTTEDNRAKVRLERLRDWHASFRERRMFHPFMSDIIGNTICADLLDYLPRDRMNLGMEWRQHQRLQRYLTIRQGTLYPDEGSRVSIMVTRPGRGGQRRDVATAVLDIMRERYEMAERVYYHHKKSAASTMLAKLAELNPQAKPSDSEAIYPAPWSGTEAPPEPNMVHFSDASFVDHLGKAPSKDPAARGLQRSLYIGLRFDRGALYRTLMVIDTDLVHLSSRPISFFAAALREYEGKASSRGRQELEAQLASAAKVSPGEILVYCPSPEMQSKEVDARLEIIEGRVLPLRVQTESFAYHADVQVLQQYYEELWRMYIFVSPKLYENPIACKAVVDKFCELYSIDTMVAYSKVRRYDFKLTLDVVARNALDPLRRFIDKSDQQAAPFDIPSDVSAGLLGLAAKDRIFLTCIKSRADPYPRIAALLDMVLLGRAAKNGFPPAKQRAIREHIRRLELGEASSRLVAARNLAKHDGYTIQDYLNELLSSV